LGIRIYLEFGIWDLGISSEGYGLPCPCIGGIDNKGEKDGL